jgi:hypothetical protein
VVDDPRSDRGEPVLVVDGDAYPPWSEEAFAAVLLVLATPTAEETALLKAAAAPGPVSGVTDTAVDGVTDTVGGVTDKLLGGGEEEKRR